MNTYIDLFVIGKQLAQRARVIHVRLPDLVNGSDDLHKELDGLLQICYQIHEEARLKEEASIATNNGDASATQAAA